jgi:hypothetical protein
LDEGRVTTGSQKGSELTIATPRLKKLASLIDALV